MGGAIVIKEIIRQPGLEYVLSLSYGKDSLACLRAIELLKWPLDRVVTAEVWATDTISADLPPMVEFKSKADKIIKDRWGIEVEHVDSGLTYEQCFYKKRKAGYIAGWPFTKGAWCQSLLKVKALDKCYSKNTVSYRGIAADESKRLARLDNVTEFSPLEAIGWTEAMCRKWCEDNDLLSPIYADASRAGCWFCHCQSVNELRKLRKRYPEYWAMLLKWDKDSPFTYRANGQSVLDFEKRFQLEDKNLIPRDHTFKWDMINLSEQELKNIEFNRKVKCVETQEVYANIAEASLQTGVPKSNIRSCLNGKRKTAYGKTWVYVED